MTEHDPLVGYLEVWVELRGCTRGTPCTHGYDEFRCWRHRRQYRIAVRWARLRRRRMVESCGTATATLDGR